MISDGKITAFLTPWVCTSKTDRVFRSTRIEDRVYADLRVGDTAMDGIELSAADKLQSFPALARDVFQSVYALNVRQNDEEILTPSARKINKHILDYESE